MGEQPKSFREIESWVIAVECNECRGITKLLGYSSTMREQVGEGYGIGGSESPVCRSGTKCVYNVIRSGEHTVRIQTDVGERGVSVDHHVR